MRGGWKTTEITPIRPEWLADYQKNGIDFRSLACEPVTWWDKEIVNMLAEAGPEHFRKIAIWDKDWSGTARQIGVMNSNFQDPRSTFEKVAHRLLALTQGHRANLGVRAFERLLRCRGW